MSPTRRLSVLFVCIHNSGRSQMAEAFLKASGEDQFDVQSAGIEPGVLNPTVVEVMKEVGIDISQNKTKDVGKFLREGRRFTHVITVCDETSAERCPVFPWPAQRFHWSFEDPAALTGTPEEKKKKTREIREKIRMRVKEFADKESEVLTEKGK